MTWAKRMKLRLAIWLLGPSEDLEKLVGETYEAIWPKHHFYKDATMEMLGKALHLARAIGGHAGILVAVGFGCALMGVATGSFR